MKILYISSDSIKFRKELMNISGILSTLMVYAVEYGMEHAITDLRDKKRMVEELTNEANAGNLSLKSTTTDQNIVNISRSNSQNSEKKIYFDMDGLRKNCTMASRMILQYQIFGVTLYKHYVFNIMAD